MSLLVRRAILLAKCGHFLRQIRYWTCLHDYKSQVIDASGLASQWRSSLHNAVSRTKCIPEWSDGLTDQDFRAKARV